MRNSKIVKVLMSSALVASVAVASAMSTAAISNLSQLKDHFVGVTGSFNNWDVTDVELTDANGDGIINISDVTGMLNAVMSENFDNINSSNADMNNDGIINITDVTLLINHLMSL